MFHPEFFQNFDRQNLDGVNSVLNVAITPKDLILTVDCAICLSREAGMSCVTSCGHSFHYECLRIAIVNGADHLVNSRCPICRAGLYSGILLPEGPADAQGVRPPPRELAFERYYMELPRSMNNNIGERLERLMLPVVLEEAVIPKMKRLGLADWQKYYGPYPVEISMYHGTRTVALVPGIVSELNAWWAHKDRTYENYKVSTLKCRELLRSISMSSQFLEFNLTYAPLASLHSNRHVEASILAQPQIEAATIIKTGKYVMIALVLFGAYRKVKKFFGDKPREQ